MFESTERYFFGLFLVKQLGVRFNNCMSWWIYLPDSIKEQTRQNAQLVSKVFQVNVNNVRPNIQLTTDWRQFLGNEDSKTDTFKDYWRNDFHFSEVHERKNAMGSVQCSGAILTLVFEVSDTLMVSG